MVFGGFLTPICTYSFLSDNSDKFEELLAGFESTFDIGDHEFDSIPLENLEAYQTQLDETSQALDAVLASSDN